MSQIQKLNYVDGKLGAPTGGQQTTRILFNTIVNPGATSSLIFFRNFQGLTSGQTNLNQNKLDSSESQIIKTVTFMQFAANGSLQTLGFSRQQTFSIIVGNQTVVKNLPIQFNQGTTGQAFDRLHDNGGASFNNFTSTALLQRQQPCEIRLLTDIVIPPQVAFEVRVDSLNGPYPASGAVVCVLSGYGKIFSAGNSF